MGAISEKEWDQYNCEFEKGREHLKEIDLFILIKCELQENVRRIKLRNRGYDESKEIDYLISLNNQYKLFKDYVKEQQPNCQIFEIDSTCMTPIEVMFAVENYIFETYIKEEDCQKKMTDEPFKREFDKIVI